MIKNKYLVISFIALCYFTIDGFAANFSFRSPTFSNNSSIPKKYTCYGENISPTLFWENAPANTKSFVLIVDDTDAIAGDSVQWLLFNIPAHVWFLPAAAKIPSGAISGQNSFGNTRYHGPCPLTGTHHYFFKLIALDKILNLNSKASREDVLKAISSHGIKTRELMGLYTKQ
ncbi:YbhB/YbcL family Raf kinase inhibitor-like protein [Legionella sp.]|uniref:YbhB/YbcL family Raf kinase inhibitor-like protein n=1 Tax=Legionella sp. TaxID=459 RepID=UPI000CBB3885|nr:YbhB/YbcL family Raf kinase inhibitor-like protein [Legionella sp.]PJE05981.1 MAG: YbhB/YbcL family Raf kinase inhibitor-like protein [Legionella sp.]